MTVDQVASIYFVGVGGIGVSALAQYALERGWRVTGADLNVDLQANPALARLAAGGAVIFAGHATSQLPPDATMVVASAAVPATNPEVAEALRRGLPVLSRAEYLGRLMDDHHAPRFAVAGTHGKSSTTAMLGGILAGAGRGPAVFVGAEAPQIGGNMLSGRPDGPFVAEACEAFESYLELRPDIAIVTNVEADHLDYFGHEAAVFASFGRFVSGIRRDGALLLWADDPGADMLAASASDGVRVFRCSATDPQADFVVRSIQLTPQTAFELVAPDSRQVIHLAVLGRHNIQNAALAAAAAWIGGVSLAESAVALAAFPGTERRMEILGYRSIEGRCITVIDDYAHHPAEIRATLSAVRTAWPNLRIAILFQPHLYSRTRDFAEAFAQELGLADALSVLPIYPAREAPIEGVDGAMVAARANQLRPELAATGLIDANSAPAEALRLLPDGGVALFMGAGDIRLQSEAMAALGEACLPPAGSASASMFHAGRSAHGRLNVAVLMGGSSSERAVSLATGKMLMAALQGERFNVRTIDTADVAPLLLPAHEPRAAAEPARRPDVVVIALHGRGGEDGCVQGMLELAGIPYTGSGVLASALAMDKVMTKRILAYEGIPAPPHCLAQRNPAPDVGRLAQKVEHELGFPVFVKPNREGSTVGCGLAADSETLVHAVREALTFDHTVIIEKYVGGMEVTAGVLGNSSQPETIEALPLIEIVPRARYYDYASKYDAGGSEHVIPARLDPDVTQQIKSWAVTAHRTLGCSGMSRSDFIVNDEGVWFLEINTVPGMTATSLLPQAAAAAGISFPQLAERLIDYALTVHALEKPLPTAVFEGSAKRI
ncbi:MAG: UDP-N-acetylmuramate--L-alanine ligase [Armatimonadetes bacterium]|nr:UDP-N-acetylmuramate--L-alanine ligase [Armatimonadota bacterium]MDE2205220.1 UDP-N-acetylmuramate--L-alanine ligase [Armatimonadota bacterium]